MGFIKGTKASRHRSVIVINDSVQFYADIVMH